MIGFANHLEAYHEGKIAYIADVPLDDCPYQEGTRDHQQWCGGWREMQADETETQSC